MVDHVEPSQPPFIPEILGDRFKSHLITLEVAYETSEHPTPRIALISGFAVAHRGLLFWVTANHCLAMLQELDRSQEAHVGQVRWCDRFGNSDAQAIPTSLSEVLRLAVGQDTSDVGVVVPRQNVQDLVAVNKNVKPLAFNQPPREGFEHVGYCLVGLPNQMLDAEVVEQEGHWTTAWNAKVVCITSHLRIPHDSAELPSPGRPDCMYGRLHLDNRLHNIAGMSGGPVFAIGRRNTDWQYRLAGIQSAWFERQRITCVAKIDDVVKMVARLCERIPAALPKDAEN